MTVHEFIGTRREAGAKVHHVVTCDGHVIGERRSAHTYGFAFVIRYGDRYHVSRYSHRPAARGGEIVVAFVAAVPAAPKADMWRVEYADGESRDVAVSARKSPHMAGREARPGVAIVGARKVIA